MRANEIIAEAPRVFYHGSMNYLEPDTILTPRDDYESNWGHTDFYKVLEHYRPEDMLSHNNSVFMCDNDEDVDLAGGGTEWLFIVEPLGKIEKHDINWSSEISMLISDGYSINNNKVKEVAYNYWHGIPHYNEQV